MLDIVVPVYNEALNIENCLNELSRKIAIPFRVMIVYDFHEDNTLPVLETIKNNYKFQINLVKNNIGRGPLNAIKAGFQASKSEAVLVLMADLADDVKIVDDMYHLFEKGIDIVCGSRYMKGGKHRGGPLLKGILSRYAGISLHYLTGIPTKDATNSFKLYSRRVIQIPIESVGGFELGMELVIKAYFKGYMIAELPSTWRERTAGKSRFDMKKWIPQYLKWYMKALKWKYLKNTIT